MNQQTNPPTIKKSQQRNLLAVGAVALVLCLGLYYALGSRQSADKPKEKTETVQVATPLDHVDNQTFWVEKAQNQLDKATKTQDALKEQLQLLQQGKEVEDKNTVQQAQQIQQLQTEITALQQKLTQKPASGFSNIPQEGDNSAPPFINHITLHLTPRVTAADLIPVRNPNTFVPAGTFVRAVTLEGADASAGVTSQGDPSPMLFRILDQGTLPNHRHSHLKNCVATAAAIGDISSERGQIRLERLSCTKDDGQIIELAVEATIAGPDGKNGVRGNALWREGALLQRAFAAGALSGFSNGIAQSYTTNSISPLGVTSTVDNGKIFQYGLANGVGNAANKLADYNIKRAEQYHPVIQLSAGTVVDIVFLKGFYLDGQKHRDDEPAYLSPITATNPADVKALFGNPSGAPAPLPLTAEQIAALKQKNAQQGYQ